MAPIDVDPQKYFSASASTRFSAQQLVGALSQLGSGLSSSGGMAGSDNTGEEFGGSYDQAARDAAAVVAGLADMSHNAADLLKASGDNHAAANRASTEGSAPTSSVPLPAHTATSVPDIPSAYGGGGSEPTGAIGTAWHYIQKWVGYVWPNGDPAKLEAAAQAWTTVANSINTGGGPLDQAKTAISEQKSPEIPSATSHLADLKGKFESAAGACLAMASSCNNLAQAIRDAHTELVNELAQFAAEFVVGEIIFAAAFEIGGELWGNALMAARAAVIARRCATIIEKLIQLARQAARIAKTAGEKIKALVDKIKSIVAAIAKRSPKTSKLDADDLLAMADYTGDGYRELNTALRSGTLDASQQARIDAINNALAKMPKYEGPVFRGTDLPADVLARYQPGTVVTESAFTSTSTNAAIAKSADFAGNVEFRIISNSGRDVSAVSNFAHEQEILFSSGSKFYVASRNIDPATGRTIIEMIQR
ncbi:MULTISPECIES: ADP-ribosyltransferase [Mycobacteroides]|uniref:NAD(+)--arginine ADP-ribosyltransferase n=1 Tax=Mycobacteroides saopaulense TaxID=1578165 RepID=A0ABX3C1E0_9MYCO|nr:MULTISPECIES: ADP-ribosyltransferase [Mycobacteroides]EIT90869.1 putative NAD(+)--arginine ADP-ribosyltransferase Mav [Mycobacteroides abscessus 4S-0303]EIT92868.1 putative NAD(+)--arginine ADP-ribosyltransferase Mav [Mycobacteroides abscessus 4S-0726-RB]EIT96413.1 putative NAD(+)--arginine ADP-ribosyltransferase Mav [Mycobacteroides abscessus 4S-0726-RA]EIV09826.1 putative NAD(+)--arginine ADP-ribosyltransferase Mav [Mycobacteroides abscessus 4S-0206]EIV48139.1 putative NAD(+)--arginine AD